MRLFPRGSVLIASALTLPMLVACDVKENRSGVTLANPASEYCVALGGKLEIVREKGGEKGLCHLPDGSVIEEWELFRRDNPQE